MELSILYYKSVVEVTMRKNERVDQVLTSFLLPTVYARFEDVDSIQTGILSVTALYRTS